MTSTVQHLVRLAVIEEAQNYEHAVHTTDDLNEKAKLSNVARGLRLAARIVKEWKPNAGAVPRRGSDVGTSPLLAISGSEDK
jgi:hypothetical protein